MLFFFRAQIESRTENRNVQAREHGLVVAVTQQRWNRKMVVRIRTALLLFTSGIVKRVY